MLKPNTDKLTGAIVVPDPLQEARELLRLIDEGKYEQLSAAVAEMRRRARVTAMREVLGELEEETESDHLEAAV